MGDPMTFEARLADVFGRYVEPVETEVDATLLARTVAATAPRRRSWFAGLRPSSSTVRALVLLALLLALALAIIQAGRRPPPPPFGVADNGLVAWADDGEIRIGDPSRTDAVRVIELPGDQFEPAFSFDGRRLLAYTVQSDPQGAVQVDLQVVSVDGSGVRTLDQDPLEDLFQMGWLPGDREVFAVTPVDGRGVIRLYDVDGRMGPRTIAFDGDVVEVRPRPPDGRQLLVTATTGEGNGLFLLDLQSGSSRTLVEPRPRTNERDLLESRWSPDGATIAFQAWSDKPPLMQVFTLALDGSPPKRLTHDEHAWYEGWPRWSPDGRRIAILRLFYDLSGQPSLDERPVAIAWVDGHAPTIESGPIMSGNVRRHDWSPDGRWIIERSDDDDQILVDPDGGPAVSLPWTSTSLPSWQRVAAPGT
jgi:Tol biopolymer transport system component